jgi:hypothetical protein
MLTTISEELGPPVSFGGVELGSLLESCVVGERPSAPLGRNDPGGERRPVCLARTLSRSERGFFCG